MTTIAHDPTAFTAGEKYMLVVPPHLAAVHKDKLESFTLMLAHNGVIMTIHPHDADIAVLTANGTSIMGHELVFIRSAESITTRGNKTHILLEKASGDTAVTIMEHPSCTHTKA